MNRYLLLNPWPREALRFARAVERTGELIAAARRGLGEEYGLPVPAWRLLQTVALSSVPLSISELSRRLRLSRQSTHATAIDLQARGLLRIGSSMNDGRIQVASLTQAGVRSVGFIEATMRVLLLEMTNDIPMDVLESTATALEGVSTRLKSCKSILDGRVRRGKRRERREGDERDERGDRGASGERGPRQPRKIRQGT